MFFSKLFYYSDFTNAHASHFIIIMAEVNDVNNSNVELANRIIDNNLHQNTKKQYSN